MRDIANIVDRDTVTKRRHINLPKPVLKSMAKALDYVWWPTIAPDEVEREFLDQKIDPTAKTFADLGITPDDVDTNANEYLRHLRSVYLPGFPSLGADLLIITPPPAQPGQVLQFAADDREGEEGREAISARRS